MRLAIHLTPLPLPDALDMAYAASQRPDVDPSQRLAPPAWFSAASSALLRRDQAGLEILLRAELAPAVAQALVWLGTTVVAASARPEDDLEQWVLEMSIRLDKTCLAVLHAIKVVGVAERWESLAGLDDVPLTRPEAGAGSRVLEKASRYLLEPDDVARRAVHEDLAHALRKLASPAEALITSMDAGRLDELLTYPLQFQLYRAYAAGAAALAYELALLGEGPLAEPTPLRGPE